METTNNFSELTNNTLLISVKKEMNAEFFSINQISKFIFANRSAAFNALFKRLYPNEKLTKETVNRLISTNFKYHTVDGVILKRKISYNEDKTVKTTEFVKMEKFTLNACLFALFRKPEQEIHALGETITETVTVSVETEKVTKEDKVKGNKASKKDAA